MNHLTIIQPGSSPFDQIRRTREDGSEYWSGRDLMGLMGYDSWQKFESVIFRAVQAAKNTGYYTDVAFSQVTQLTRAGNLGDQQRRDYHLDRHAAYLVAMNGDPSKPEVALAQAYFAAMTRQAEANALPKTFDDPLEELEYANERLTQALRIAREERRRAEEEAQERHIAERMTALAVRQVIELEPDAELAKMVLAANGTIDVGTAAKLLRNSGVVTGRQRLFDQLAAWKWIFRRGEEWAPYQDQVECDRLRIKGSFYEDPNTGEMRPRTQVRMTFKGLRDAHQRFQAPLPLPEDVAEYFTA